VSEGRDQPMKSSIIAWLSVAITIMLTIYGQLVVKWQVLQRGRLPVAFHDKVSYLLRFFLSPWMLSVLFATGVAAVTWVTALSHLELSRAYPFTALSFVTVLLLSAVFFGETITAAKLAGVALVVAGLVVGASL
jgi:multidrug transporter EmrE-like cation transporter